MPAFGFSVGDLIPMVPICKDLIAAEDFSTPSRHAIQTNRQLSTLLSNLSDAFKIDCSGKVFASGEAQATPAGMLSGIRRDMQAFAEASHKQIRRTGNRSGPLVRGEVEADILDRLSERNVELQAWLKRTTDPEAILLPTKTASEANSSEEKNRIRQWLGGPHNEAIHAEFVSRRRQGTGSWILKIPQYQMWKDSRASFLWLSGIPGSGKSVLSAYVIENLRLKDAGGHRVAFYHFDSRDPYANSLERCLMSVIGQLISEETAIPTVIQNLYFNHAGSSMSPSVQILQEILFSVVSMQSGCFVVLDALDECSELEEMLRVLNALRRRGSKNPQKLRVLVTSRNEPQISAALNTGLPDEYAVCIEIDDKEFIAEQFGDLNSMYKSMLLTIPPQKFGLVRRIFMWIITSARPLTTKEVSSAVALNTAGKPVSPNDRLIDPDEIMTLCSDFLFHDTEGDTLNLKHRSERDFLRSEHTSGPLVGFRHSDGDRILTDCCVTYLLMFSEGDSLRDKDLNEFPLLAYAAEYWPYHARRVEDAQSWSPNTTQLIMRLFYEDNGTLFCNWLKAFEPATLQGSVDPTSKVDTGSSPMFYASILGLPHVLNSIIETEGEIATPEMEFSLYGASYYGHADIVSLLLDRAVSPNSEPWSGARPLGVAILKRHAPVVKLLLDRNADVTYKDGIFGNPFQTAISVGDAALVKLTIRPTKATMAPEAFLEILSQGFRDAARNGHLEVVQFCFDLDAQADLDAVDEVGWTALHYAIRYKHNHIQQYLIDHGADIDRQNFAGETPADFAWSDRRLDLSLYNNVIELKKEAKQAFSCHILQQRSDSGHCRKSIFRKTFKFKNKNRVAKPKAKKAIIREHTILQRINHPFIVSYLWYEEDKEQEMAQLYLEYCNGGDLDIYNARAVSTIDEENSSDENDQSTQSGPCLTPKELWRYMFQVAAALAYLHHGLSLRQDGVFTFEKQWDQILHRDIKPSNIVLDTPESGLPQAKICDLGLAKGLSSKLREAKETGGIGTRNYWPPEMFQNGFWTAKGDIFSYGSTFNDLWNKSSMSSCDFHSSKAILKKCMSHLPVDRPCSIELLEIVRNHVIEELPLSTSRLHDLLGDSQAGYLHDAFYDIARQLDTKETFDSRSVKVRRESSLKRLKLLCDDGAGSIFDTQPGPPTMKLHLAVLLDREAAFNQALESSQAVNSPWPDSGWTPLHLAAQEKNFGMYLRLHQLLEANAEQLVSDRDGHVASYYLPQSGSDIILR